MISNLWLKKSYSNSLDQQVKYVWYVILSPDWSDVWSKWTNGFHRDKSTVTVTPLGQYCALGINIDYDPSQNYPQDINELWPQQLCSRGPWSSPLLTPSRFLPYCQEWRTKSYKKFHLREEVWLETLDSNLVCVHRRESVLAHRLMLEARCSRVLCLVRADMARCALPRTAYDSD